MIRLLALAYSTAYCDVSTKTLVDQLMVIRSHVSHLEQGLIDGLRSRKNTKKQVFKIQKPIQFQHLERELGKKRLVELEKTVAELESRKLFLQAKLTTHQKAIRRSLIAIEASSRGEGLAQLRSFHLPEEEKLEAPRRKILANLVDHDLREVEALRVDLVDSIQLESKIQDEKQQLTYLFQDLKEQEGVLELNHQLQVEILRKKQNDRVKQLENYRNLKSAEGQVEHLIQEFNARRELERNVEAERQASRSLGRGEFAQLKGRLPFPAQGGKVISHFGRFFDSKSGLYIFKKGIDISFPKKQTVHAISSGKVAYSGELLNYGRVVIVDHGDHFYSLYAHLGVITQKTNESLISGESIGLTSDLNTPLYFEIRSRNVAVNPLQWVFN